MSDNKIFYRQKLPHYQPSEGTFFVTYRLYGSIPKEVIVKLEAEREERLKQMRKEFVRNRQLKLNDKVKGKQFVKSVEFLNEHKKHFAKMDAFLDQATNGPVWLKNQEIAEVIAASLVDCSKRYFTLWAFTIMSNHVHILITLNENSPILFKVMQRHKSFTARLANKILGRTGSSFWEGESYDHLVRDYDNSAFGNIVDYILQNPVKAGLVKDWRDWKFSYLNPSVYE